jgi:ribosomal protein S18 acetylase RimI-like enzyme
MECSIDWLNEIEKGDIKSIKLTEEYEIKPFDCEVKDLNEFLFNDAKSYVKHLYYTTFLFENQEKTIAYYCLANDSLNITLETNRTLNSEIKKLVEKNHWQTKSYLKPPFPAVKIGRLAVDKGFQNKGLGTSILEMLTISFIENNKTGCQFITVDALNNKKALEFYEKNGFHFISTQIQSKESKPMYKSLLGMIDI